MIYRVHEPAQPHQLERLEPMLACFGIRVSGRGGITQQAIQSALAQAEQRPAGHILRRLILRAMSRAQYSPENVGHFGLASESYCHFTSPIRRYPDLVVHRILARTFEGAQAPTGQEHEAMTEEMSRVAQQSSDRERQAQQMEWDTTALKSLEFMQQHLGEEFEAYISGVQSYGLFIELETFPVEGMIPLRGLPPDRWEIDEIGSRLTGSRSGRTLRLADRVRVRVERIDLPSLQLDLSYVVQGPAAVAQGKERKKRKR